jgi:hypothetical protein
MAEAEAPRVRRIRVTGSKGREKPLMDRDLLNSALKRIADNNAEIAELQREQAAITANLLKMMQANKLKEWEIKEAVAKIVIPQGRATNEIDAEAFYKLVSEEDFFDSIKVSMEKAKKHLGKKELEKITTTTPGKLGEPKLDFEYR